MHRNSHSFTLPFHFSSHPREQEQEQEQDPEQEQQRAVHPLLAKRRKRPTGRDGRWCPRGNVGLPSRRRTDDRMKKYARRKIKASSRTGRWWGQDEERGKYADMDAANILTRTERDR